ncbi:MAG: hypothetical protein V2I33_23645 [Kangiellaceae bacterium]|jgi:hypothetical protein|nr:hypothetical protein [Kangiellaceae bacterium]
MIRKKKEREIISKVVAARQKKKSLEENPEAPYMDEGNAQEDENLPISEVRNRQVTLTHFTGNGSDVIGTYNIRGSFCSTNCRMILRKTYVPGTGDPNENLGHTVLCQLRWSE